MRYVTITTKRLYLGNLKIENVWELYSYRSCPLVEKYQSWKNYSYAEAFDLIMRMKDQDFHGQPGIYQWGIYLNQKLIGDIFWELEHNGVCWVGYTLNPNEWHKGYAYEAMQAFIDYLHNIYHIQVFMAYILNENESSKHLIHKLDFSMLYPQVYIKNTW